MRSSTFSSKPAALIHAQVLMGICAVLVVSFEMCANYLLKHYSSTYQRVSRQYAEAVKVRPSRPGEPASVLMVGNSLLLAGVDIDRLQTLTSGRMRIHPIFLEGTAYYDWLYGLRRLFRQGARPEVVVVGLPVNYFLDAMVRQEYTPMMLLDAQDVFGVAGDLRLDRTAASNLLLAHSSSFWDARSILRAQILRGIVPRFENLTSLITTRRTLPPEAEFEARATSRLRTLRELCEVHGAKLIMLIPPTPSSEGAIRQMTIASQRLGVQTFVPIDPRALPAGFYEPDATHLNSKGASLFTSALALDLTENIVVRRPVLSPD